MYQMIGLTDDYSENDSLLGMQNNKSDLHVPLEEKDSNSGEEANAQVARLNAERGFGFLKMDSGKEMFFHARVLVDDIDFTQLIPGDRVFASIGESERGKGLEATKVIIKTMGAFKRAPMPRMSSDNSRFSKQNPVWPGDRDRDNSPHAQPHFQYGLGASSGVVQKEGTIMEVDGRGISWVKTSPPHPMEQLFFAQEEFQGDWNTLRIGEAVSFLHRPGNRQIREVRPAYHSGEHFLPPNGSLFSRGRAVVNPRNGGYRSPAGALPHIQEVPFCKGEIVRLTERGFGFAKICGTNEEVYFHAKHIKDGSEFREYKKGDLLIFRLSPSFDPNHSTTAVDIQILKEEQGIIKRLNSRGFGFLSSSSQKDEIYFHAKHLQPPAEFTSLKVGQALKYTRDLSDTKQGEFEAVNVQLVEEEEA